MFIQVKATSNGEQGIGLEITTRTGSNRSAMAIEAIAIVSLILLSVLVFALASFIAKHRSVAALKLLPGRKPSYLFGNALQLTGEAHGEYY